MVAFLRIVASLALGLVVFAGLLALLVGINFTQRLDDSRVYAAAFSESGAYIRIYEEVLVDESLEKHTGRLLEDIGIAAHDDAVDLLRQVMPPEYLREQVEANIGRFTAFLRHQRDYLEIYVDLQAPLERVEPTALGKVHEYIDDLEVADPPLSGCSPSSLQRLAAAAAEPYSRLSQGQLPETAPSLEILSRDCREREFDRWFGLVLNDHALNAQASRILGNEVEGLRRTFVDGDTRGFLKAAADPLVEPVVEGAVAEVRRNLPPDERIDVLERLAGPPGSPARAKLEAQAEFLRGALSTVNGPGKLIALALVIAGSLLLALVHLPQPRAMLRWPGVTLLAGGSVCLVVGLILHSYVPSLVREGVMSRVSFPASVPASAIHLGGDLGESFIHQATAGFIPATLAVMALGAVLIAASLSYGGLLPMVVRRVLGRAPPASSATVRNRR